jgi:hypothetical protein
VHFRELPVAIEVKRPASLASVQANVSQGLGQCREFARLSAIGGDGAGPACLLPWLGYSPVITQVREPNRPQTAGCTNR